MRVSLFVDPSGSPIRWARRYGRRSRRVVHRAVRPGVRARRASDAERLRSLPARGGGSRAEALGLGVNAGHDLDLENLPYLSRHLPGLLEVSIGHALISDALFLGLDRAVRDYLAVLDI